MRLLSALAVLLVVASQANCFVINWRVVNTLVLDQTNNPITFNVSVTIGNSTFSIANVPPNSVKPPSESPSSRYLTTDISTEPTVSFDFYDVNSPSVQPFGAGFFTPGVDFDDGSYITLVPYQLAGQTTLSVSLLRDAYDRVLLAPITVSAANFSIRFFSGDDTNPPVNLALAITTVSNDGLNETFDFGNSYGQGSATSYVTLASSKKYQWLINSVAGGKRRASVPTFPADGSFLSLADTIMTVFVLGPLANPGPLLAFADGLTVQIAPPTTPPPSSAVPTTAPPSPSPSSTVAPGGTTTAAATVAPATTTATLAPSTGVKEAEFFFKLTSCLAPGTPDLALLYAAFALAAGVAENFIVIVAPAGCPSLSRQATEQEYLAKITDPNPSAGPDALVLAQQLVQAINTGTITGAPPQLKTGPGAATQPTAVKSLAVGPAAALGVVAACAAALLLA